MTLLTLIILSLAVWRISSLLVQEDGPYQVLLTIRNYTKLFDCIWCMSVWVGISITVFWVLMPEYAIILALPFALSAVAIMFDRWSQ